MWFDQRARWRAGSKDASGSVREACVQPLVTRCRCRFRKWARRLWGGGQAVIYWQLNLADGQASAMCVMSYFVFGAGPRVV